MYPRTHRIGFVGSRFAGIDGVSLEAKKWADVFTRNGHECFFFAGELDCLKEREYIAPEAHFAHPAITALHSTLLYGTRRTSDMTERMHEFRRTLKGHLAHFVDVYHLDTLVIENVLAIPLNVPLGIAITEFLVETGMPSIAHHHDFVWERVRFRHTCVPEYIDMAFPPRMLTNMAHVTIHTGAARALAQRKNLRAVAAPNVMDFAHPPAALAPSRRAALRVALGIAEGARVFLQPTRIVPRKEIETSILLLAHLQGQRILLIPHTDGDEDSGEYRARLMAYADAHGVDVRFVADAIIEYVGRERGILSLAECYALSDMVLYPSAWEGFGNAFIEAVYYRKPIFVRRYPVYVRDIAPKGFSVIEYEPGMHMSHVACRVERVLRNAARVEKMVSHNYAIGLRHFSYERLEQLLHRLLFAIHTA
jgi:mannosylglucosylglycerate synthase